MNTIPLCKLPKGKNRAHSGNFLSTRENRRKKSAYPSSSGFGIFARIHLCPVLIQECFTIPGLILSGALSLPSETRMPV